MDKPQMNVSACFLAIIIIIIIVVVVLLPFSDIFKMSHGDQETCTFTNKKYSANIVGDIPNCLVYGMVGGIYMQITT